MSPRKTTPPAISSSSHDDSFLESCMSRTSRWWPQTRRLPRGGVGRSGVLRRLDPAPTRERGRPPQM